MKKSTVITTLIVSLLTFASAGVVTPVLGMRFNDIAGSATDIPTPTTSIGLKMELGDNVYTGFDSSVDGTDFRIYLEQSFGKVGLGINGTSPTFSIGAIYNVYGSMNVEIEYMANQLVTDDTLTTDKDESAGQLRLSLSIAF